MSHCGRCRRRDVLFDNDCWVRTRDTRYHVCTTCMVEVKKELERSLGNSEVIEVDSDAVYMVTGYQRSGTSMMMEALKAGGMPVGERPSRIETIEDVSDDLYQLNKDLFELRREDYQKDNFPSDWRGKCIKALGKAIIGAEIQPKIKLIFMRRNYHEIHQSHRGGFEGSNANVPRITAVVEESLKWAHNRKDVDILEVWYRDLVEQDTREHMINIRDHFEVDLRVDDMVSVVNPDMCRYKLEELTIGAVPGYKEIK